MVSNLYNRILQPTKDTKRERNTNIKEGITIKTTQMESQGSRGGGLSQQAILIKANETEDKQL